MRKTLVLGLLVASTAGALRAQDVRGEWRGTLKVGAAELHLVLHISSSAKGALQATLDSVDQGGLGIPVTSIEIKASKLNFTVDSIRGSYNGVLSPDGKSLHGTWTQGQSFPLSFTLSARQPKLAKPSDIDGAWTDTLQAGPNKLRIVFHIFNTVEGLHATIDSPDQGANGIPASSVTTKGSHITIEVQSIRGKLDGIINPARTEIQGTWTQGGANLPLALERTTNVSEFELNRRHNPSLSG
ncbi:MAG TPA: hypothetical protein VFW94_06230 [Candidatus Acidoferrales bacterium]|nr:hypothetical protein [Candidatus Acidoferrales bacterium]